MNQCEICGSPTWTRTRDLRINSPSLYQLSYWGMENRKALNYIDPRESASICPSRRKRCLECRRLLI